jgi:hypothetical protein
MWRGRLRLLGGPTATVTEKIKRGLRLGAMRRLGIKAVSDRSGQVGRPNYRGLPGGNGKRLSARPWVAMSTTQTEQIILGRRSTWRPDKTNKIK